MNKAAKIIQELQAPVLTGPLKTLVWLCNHDRPAQLLKPSSGCFVFDTAGYGNRWCYWTPATYVNWLVKKGLAEHTSPGKYGHGQINLTKLGLKVASTLAISDELEGKETVP